MGGHGGFGVGAADWLLALWPKLPVNRGPWGKADFFRHCDSVQLTIIHLSNCPFFSSFNSLHVQGTVHARSHIHKLPFSDATAAEQIDHPAVTLLNKSTDTNSLSR